MSGITRAVARRRKVRRRVERKHRTYQVSFHGLAPAERVTIQLGHMVWAALRVRAAPARTRVEVHLGLFVTPGLETSLLVRIRSQVPRTEWVSLLDLVLPVDGWDDEDHLRAVEGIAGSDLAMGLLATDPAPSVTALPSHLQAQVTQRKISIRACSGHTWEWRAVRIDSKTVLGQKHCSCGAAMAPQFVPIEEAVDDGVVVPYGVALQGAPESGP